MYNGHSKIDKTKILMTNGSLMMVKSIADLMKVKSIAECSRSILQYFWPALSDIRSWKSIFGLLRVAVLNRFYCIVKLASLWFLQENVELFPSVLHSLKNYTNSHNFFLLDFGLVCSRKHSKNDSLFLKDPFVQIIWGHNSCRCAAWCW